MGALEDAKAHLAKAAEFLDAANRSLEAGLFNAAASNAVSSGINSKDAICLALTGRTAKSDNHLDAAAELTRAGGTAAALAPTMKRLLGLKNKSQYQAAPIARTDANKAVDWATRLHDGAKEIVTS